MESAATAAGAVVGKSAVENLRRSQCRSDATARSRSRVIQKCTASDRQAAIQNAYCSTLCCQVALKDGVKNTDLLAICDARGEAGRAEPHPQGWQPPAEPEAEWAP